MRQEHPQVSRVVWDGGIVLEDSQEYGHICFHIECAREFQKKFAADLE